MAGLLGGSGLRVKRIRSRSAVPGTGTKIGVREVPLRRRVFSKEREQIVRMSLPMFTVVVLCSCGSALLAQEWTPDAGTNSLSTQADQVLIGTTTTTASSMLHVEGRISSSHAGPGFVMIETDAADQSWQLLGVGGEFRIRDLTAGNVYPLRIEPGQSMNDLLWLDNTGNVGIGITDPQSKLAVGGTVESTTGGFKFPDGSVQSTAAMSGSAAYGASSSAPANAIYVDQLGNVGVGTVYPGARLAIGGGVFASGDVTSSGKVISTTGGFQFPDGTTQTTSSTADGNSLDAADGLLLDVVYVDTAGQVGVGTKSPATALDVRGTTTTQTLEVTGGADLSEAFDVSTGEQILPGMVVSIDPARPGGLRVARQEYDRTVAGVVSGAGGVQPGMVMGQRGTLAAGDHPIALSGRVYVLADTSAGSIRPGDFLTTSSVPGHAMRVDDPLRAMGSVLGKAMTGLDEGRGLVLVLMALQ